MQFDIREMIYQDFMEKSVYDFKSCKKFIHFHKMEDKFCENLTKEQVQQYERLMELHGDFEIERYEELIDYVVSFMTTIFKG